MGINDLLHIVKTYTLAIHHRVKGMFLKLVLDTNAIVGNLNLGLIVLCTSHANTDNRIVRGKVNGVAEQYLKDFLQLHLIEIGSQLVDGSQEVHLDLLFRIWRHIMFADITRIDDKVFCCQIQFDNLFFRSVRLRLVGLLRSHLHTHLVHPLLFLEFTSHRLNIHAALLMLHEPLTPQEGSTGNDEHVEQYHPACTPQRWTDGDFERRLFFAKRAVVVQHPDTEGIVACTKRVIGDVRILFRCPDPVVIETFQHIDETLAVIDDSRITGQLDGKLVVEAQRQLAAHVEGLVQYDTSVNLLPYRHVFIENLKTTEDGTFLPLHIRECLRIDDIQSTLSTNQQQAVVRQTGGTLVIGALHQTITVIIAAHTEIPLAIIL